MTPVGHASISVIAGIKLNQKHFYALFFGSLIPDIDFLLLPLEAFNNLHRAVTHNIFFLLIISLFILPFFRVKDIWVPVLFLTGGISHLLIDSILDANPSNGVGIALFWPLSENYFSPFNLLSSYESSYNWDQPVKFLFSLGRSFIIEIPFFTIALFLLPKRLKHAF